MSEDDEREMTDGWRSCNQCVCWRPPRTYHCRICGYCVLRRDHHCPWINGCVGLKNYRYFFFFLLYLSLGCIYISLSLIPLLFFPGSKEDPISLDPTDKARMMFSLVLSSIFAVILLGLTSFHAYFISTNQTNIEYVKNDVLSIEYRMRGEVRFHSVTKLT